MNKLMIAAVALVVASSAEAQTNGGFQRPDCSAYKDAPKPESKCFGRTKNAWKFANYGAVQKAGLEFIHMARPDLKTSPAAKKALDDKVEGAFAITYSVNQGGAVYDVKVKSASTGIEALANLWAETIKQWTFVKPGKPVVDVEYRRIYLYSNDDAVEEAKKKREND